MNSPMNLPRPNPCSLSSIVSNFPADNSAEFWDGAYTALIKERFMELSYDQLKTILCVLFGAGNYRRGLLITQNKELFAREAARVIMENGTAYIVEHIRSDALRFFLRSEIHPLLVKRANHRQIRAFSPRM